MESKLMGVATFSVLIITIATCYMLMHFQNMHFVALEFQDALMASEGRQSVIESVQEEEPSNTIATAGDDILQGHQFRLKLPANVTSAAVSIDSDYVDKVVNITINGIGKNYFDDYPMTGNVSNIVDITYESENMVGVISITMDDVKEVQMTAGDDCVYFDLVDPHDIYDYVVVVDAGHGGNVPGANKQGVSEKDLDLDFVLELKKYFDRSDYNIGVYYTRTTDCNPSFASRVDLANDSEADLFISIHNNSTASGRISSISGTEVMYKGSDTSGKSKEFASLVLDKLLDSLGSKSKGTVVGDDIYIIRTSEAPVALIEVGFMTNVEELENLQDPEYQQKTAGAIYSAVIEYLYD